MSISAAGCSSSSAAGGPGTDASSGGQDSTAGDDSSADTGSGSSSGTEASADSSSSSSGGGDSGDGSACTTPEGGAIPVTFADGGANQPCMDCVATSCCDQQNACVADPNLVVADDAGTMYPACDVYINCIYGEVTTLLASTDAAVTTDLATAEADCGGADGGNFPASSIQAGGALIGCFAASCAALCGL